jgi:hypothetical protein
MAGGEQHARHGKNPVAALAARSRSSPSRITGLANSR